MAPTASQEKTHSASIGFLLRPSKIEAFLKYHV
jgi:hypothetical protein